MTCKDPETAGDKTSPSWNASGSQDTNSSEQTFISNDGGDVEGKPAAADMVELPEGRLLGKYQIERLLGKGAMGAVYLAFDPVIERHVAIKVLPADVARNRTALGRFLTEARSTGKLSHPHVVSVFDIAEHDGLHYIVMELLTGGSVADQVSNQASLSWQRACRIVAEAAEGLAAAHHAGLVHRDIKPDNLMITQDGIVKVVDFGLSKLVDAASDTRDSMTRTGAILGTPQYMSPEQCEAAPVDGRSDIYSLGGTLFRLLTGRLPYEEFPSIMQVMMAHAGKPVPDPLAHRPDLPKACRTIVMKAMAKAPKDRYQDAGEMASELKALLYGGVSARATELAKASQDYRALRSILIVEPSKMQALMQQKAFAQSGAESVTVCSNATEARATLETAQPDVFITAMELGDGRGVELLTEQRAKRGRDVLLVLNSTGSTIEELVDSGHSEPLALVSKKTKPDEIIRAVHAGTFLNIAKGPLTETIDPSGSRLLVVSDSERIPDPIAQQLRRMNVLDLQVTTFDRLAGGQRPSGTIDLVLAVRTAGDAEGDTSVYAGLMGRIRIDAHVVAALQVDGEHVTLRAVRRGGFAVLTRCPLDDVRLTRLLQVIHH